MTKRKKSWVGWVGKDRKLRDFLYYLDDGYVIEASPFKGKKVEWWPSYWPPKKIRITVEEV